MIWQLLSEILSKLKNKKRFKVGCLKFLPRKNAANNNGPGEVWTKSIPNLVDPNDIDDRSHDLLGLLREIPEDEFAEAVTNNFTAHKFGARYGFIVNSRKCEQDDCRGKDTHPIFKKTFMHSQAVCCEGSILKINRAGGLYNILHMLHKRAHGKTQAEIFNELGLQEMNDKNGIFKELNNCLGIV
jgi:hypothetical protein